MTDDSKAVPKITPRENGSLRVEGLENLIDAEGNRISTTDRGKGNIALCRCGASHIKPFCDGTHKAVDFRSSRLGGDRLHQPEDYDAEPHGEPTITIVPGGPYLVAGGIDMEDVEFPDEVSPDHYVLCRCGRSRSKPFCDGAHEHVAFKDPGLDTTTDKA